MIAVFFPRGGCNIASTHCTYAGNEGWAELLGWLHRDIWFCLPGWIQFPLNHIGVIRGSTGRKFSHLIKPFSVNLAITDVNDVVRMVHTYKQSHMKT